jgi:hypothetical protein
MKLVKCFHFLRLELLKSNSGGGNLKLLRALMPSCGKEKQLTQLSTSKKCEPSGEIMYTNIVEINGSS